MKRGLVFSILCVMGFCVVGTPPCFGQWSIISTKTRPMDKQTKTEGEDVWLDVVIRNDSPNTLYAQGISWEQPWYLVEAYLQQTEGQVWVRQNVGVDRQLEMLPVKAGETFKVVRREDKASIGRSLMLTFRMAYSKHDETGSRILLGAFQIPDLHEHDSDSQPSANKDRSVEGR